MRIDIATLFPEMCERVLSESIIARARRARKIEINCHQIRDYSLDRQRRVDDYPYGGGRGMVLQPDPIFRCFEAVCSALGQKPHTIYLSPKGETFSQQTAARLKTQTPLFLICGHYEGVDQRIIDEIVDEEISLGDFVVTGGELPALLLVDAIARLCDGVLSEQVCFEEESHYGGLLEYPQYTRPCDWHGRMVPEVLLSGHHKNIARWRHEQSVALTQKLRPDLYRKASQEEMKGEPPEEKER